MYNSAIMEKSGGNCAANLSFCGTEAASSAGKGGTIISKTAETWHEAACTLPWTWPRTVKIFPRRCWRSSTSTLAFGAAFSSPINTRPFWGGGRRGNTLSNYITYGIRYGPMYDYKDHIYKDDIFRYSSCRPTSRASG